MKLMAEKINMSFDNFWQLEMANKIDAESLICHSLLIESANLQKRD
jgi:hypothetical protein